MRFVAIVAILMLAGCASSLEPSQADLKAQWEAQNVSPLNYKSDIIALMRNYLNEPAGVRSAGVSLPTRKTMPGEPGERFIACVRFDARKAGGGYAGVKTGAALYVSGKLDRFLDTPRVANEICKDAAYELFPELEKLRR